MRGGMRGGMRGRHERRHERQHESSIILLRAYFFDAGESLHTGLLGRVATW